jgi:hypothetical protein
MRTDAGSHFTSRIFCEEDANANIELYISAQTPITTSHKRRIWYSHQNIADMMIVHARIPPKCTYHANNKLID